ncbi:hypothetical protein [Helicobacter anatolicus]|uniref:hypothetical protein n=1 Tax=Helicobacter anatolicus TaxID=2905874 RepID=UPI001E49CDC1|nr:hypothetical protein [Helicobacter anatolicus]MCE3036674.1 hypothetical protein [Helicobacter anatolicus]MCE3040202.1 hypothetical protein [Helicobacter anatolicus]
MKPLNYLNLSVAMGFFLGLAFSIAKFDEPEVILFWTIVSTISFYLIAMLIISVYTWSLEFDHTIFDKNNLEKRLEFFDKEFDNREKEAQNIKHYLQSFNFNGSEK